MEKYDKIESITEEILKNIIHIYALKICKLWDYYHEILDEIKIKYKNNEFNRNEYKKRRKMLIDETKSMFADLLIEQYYNTNEDDFFDRAMMMDENVKLTPISYIDMEELQKSEEYDRRSEKTIIIFYHGLFINMNNLPDTSSALIRDPILVEKINKKIYKGRKILEIDEFTLGKKYYDGLCNRTKYYR